jgi:hypothetical protein
MRGFAGRLDRWLDPEDPVLCRCGEELEHDDCLNPECSEYLKEEEEDE